jgi:hypothetical protein
MSRVPTFVAQADTAENHDRLIDVVQIKAGVAGFIQIEEVHSGRPGSTPNEKELSYPLVAASFRKHQQCSHESKAGHRNGQRLAGALG